jgi:hypothetical protein
MSLHKFKSAQLKIGNASEHIDKVNEILRKEAPFTYILGTDTMARQRSPFTKKNDAVVDRLALVVGDVAHNLRAALDHAYSEIVLPLAIKPGEKKAVQFPFCEGPNRLAETVKNRLADRVSGAFFDTICALKPHGEPGGNKLLYLIDKMDIPDKHHTLAPVADHKALDSDVLRKQIPDFPQNLRIKDLAMSGFGRDFVWSTRLPFKLDDLGELRPPFTCVFEKKIDVPVDILLVVSEANYRGPLVPTLYNIRDVTQTILGVLKPFAN